VSKLCQFIQESSLSRVYSHNESHDCGAMTAFRRARNCNNGALYTDRERRQRNRSLLVKLVSKEYGVTKLKGMYPEGGVIINEESFFIVDLMDTGNLEKDLMEWGEEFEQDTILFIPKGTIKNENKAYLIGTNHCEDNKVGYHGRMLFDRGKFGYDSKIYTSYINGRPFIFEEYVRECRLPGSGMGNWAVHSLAKMDWKDIEIGD
jgi:hypothetical protein